MIGSSFVRQSLKTLAPALLLLLFCSIGAYAQSPSEEQELIYFNDTPLKVAINSMATQLGLNVVFDEAIKDSEKLTLELRDVSFKRALEIGLLQKKMLASIIEEKTIIVFPDNEDNRQRYEQYELWSPLPEHYRYYCPRPD